MPSRRDFLKVAGTSLVLGGLYCVQRTAYADEATKETALEICQLTNATPSQMMAYILRTKNGQIIVVDGGMPGDRDALLAQLKEMGLAEGQKIAAWLLTHAHLDHFGAIATLINENRLPAVEKIYFSFPPQEWLDTYEAHCKDQTALFYDAIKKVPQEQIVTTKAGMKLTIDNVTITVLNDFDLNLHGNAINNSTVVYRLDVPNCLSMLFLGDLGKERGQALLDTLPPEQLKADAVQMAHHGQQGVAKSFYAAVAPKECYWPTPNWLWDNNPGSGYNTGPWKTLETREWVKELGIETHHVGKDGTQRKAY